MSGADPWDDSQPFPVLDWAFNGFCATEGCRRERAYPEGSDWDRCCKRGFITGCRSHDETCVIVLDAPEDSEDGVSGGDGSGQSLLGLPIATASGVSRRVRTTLIQVRNEAQPDTTRSGAQSSHTGAQSLESRLLANAYPQQDRVLQDIPQFYPLPAYHVYLMLPSGRHAVRVTQQTTGANIMNYMIDQLDYEGARLQISFQGRLIMAGRFLTDYGVTRESMITVHGRIRAGSDQH